ncbi:acetyl-CoA carboxylase carboxyl transferase subunit beta [Chloroflexia bacterium SDU3-3]|nr:acetyl-CoA carboxylase carboxyl transferase subunit beta [Chloroflexia bacterium SDU3-3]
MKEFFRRNKKSFAPSQREDEPQIPENLWVKCPSCRELIYQKQLLDNLKVCPKCSHHMRLVPAEWLGLLDADSFVEYDADLWPADPLGFVSPKETYADKLQTVQARLGQADAVVSGVGTIDGLQLAIAICDFSFIGASMGSVYGEKMTRAAERAAELGIPLLTINSSGGARMQEGVISLMQMAKISMALTRLHAVRQPHISLLVDPCFGGVLASYPSVADVIIAEPGANIGFAGSRVVSQTIGGKMPAKHQTAEYMYEHGMVDMVTPRGELRPVLSRLLLLYSQKETAVPALPTLEPALAERQTP